MWFPRRARRNRSKGSVVPYTPESSLYAESRALLFCACRDQEKSVGSSEKIESVTAGGAGVVVASRHRQLVNLARSSRSRRIREDVVPDSSTSALVGRNYTAYERIHSEALATAGSARKELESPPRFAGCPEDSCPVGFDLQSCMICVAGVSKSATQINWRRGWVGRAPPSET